MLFQPSFGFFHCGSVRTDNAPEAGRVIGFEEVGEFVDHHVIDNEHRGLDETPIETDIVVQGAGAPPITVIDDPGCSKVYAKSASVLLNASENLIFGPHDVPVPQDLTALGLMSPRMLQRDTEAPRDCCTSTNSAAGSGYRKTVERRTRPEEGEGKYSERPELCP
jgi:hypothetical protein